MATTIRVTILIIVVKVLLPILLHSSFIGERGPPGGGGGGVNERCVCVCIIILCLPYYRYNMMMATLLHYCGLHDIVYAMAIL